MEYLVAGLAYFVFVFFKAFQQRNVAFLHYNMILPVSYALAGTEVFVYALITFSVIREGLSPALLWYVLAVGTGGGLGAMLGMKLHELTMPAMPGGDNRKIGGNNE